MAFIATTSLDPVEMLEALPPTLRSAPRAPAQSPADADRAIIGFSRKVTDDAGSVTEADVDELVRHGVSPAKILDVTATAAARAFWRKLNDALRGAPEEAAPPTLRVVEVRE